MEVVAVSGLGLPKAGMPEEYSRLADPRRDPPSGTFGPVALPSRLWRCVGYGSCLRDLLRDQRVHRRPVLDPTLPKLPNEQWPAQSLQQLLRPLTGFFP